jgi:hypothetical protein
MNEVRKGKPVKSTMDVSFLAKRYCSSPFLEVVLYFTAWCEAFLPVFASLAVYFNHTHYLP